MNKYQKEDQLSYCLGMSLTIEALKHKASFVSEVILSSKASKNNQLDLLLDLCNKHNISCHEDDILKPGTAFPLVKALAKLSQDNEKLTEIIVMSKNSANTSLRVFKSLEYYGLDVTRAVLSGGMPLTPYLEAFKTDLFLSADEEDVQEAINNGFAAGIICSHEGLPINPNDEINQIRIAFDGDAVIFSDDSEKIYKESGLDAFKEYEHKNANEPLKEGPFAKFLKTISLVQNKFSKDELPIRTALVTARNAPTHERAIRTLRAWNVKVDEAFFLGGIPKSEILKAFGANIFFDDQKIHTDPASKVVPAARVPYINKK